MTPYKRLKITKVRSCIICEKSYASTDPSDERICSDCHGGFSKFGDDIMTLKRAILYLKRSYTPGFEDSVIHGVDCQKIKHSASISYSHADNDDVTVCRDKLGRDRCGRCHLVLDSNAPRKIK